MGGFEVETEALSAASSDLRGALTVVADWNARKDLLSAMAESAGHRSMIDAIRQFCDEWNYGFGHLADDIEALAATLELAEQIYSETEQQIVAASDGDS